MAGYRKRNTRLQKLAKKEESKAVKRIFYLFIVSFVLIVFLFTVGVQILGKFADFLEIIFKKDGTSEQNTSLGIPILDSLPEATNSAKLSVSGFATNGQKIEIYLNDQRISETNIEGGKFVYDDLTLVKGENKISVKSAQDNQLSDFSQVKTVIFDNDEPSLEISNPQEGQIFSGDRRIKVSGKTEKDAQVYANGFLASVSSSGDFEVQVPLNEGENTIEIKAVDEAGNSKAQTRKVQYKK